MEYLYTPHEIAKIIKVNYRFILDEIALGKLSAFKVGRQFRISKNSLLSYLETKKVETK